MEERARVAAIPHSVARDDMLRGNDPFLLSDQHSQARASTDLHSASVVSRSDEDGHREPVGELREDIKFLGGGVPWLGRGIRHHPSHHRTRADGGAAAVDVARVPEPDA